ncbi:PAS domain S-box protein [Sphingomonas sp. SM33]|uniref:histidine kinase n=1 Tax=Sphingomonas telluris TaxID=2907998 RepID=A0ABS9VMY1_9SPHN|nr:PAS domain-containing sensor histidine kinase [Sphingomonas telluris]MCH8616331.1 PAS domain S-box protein [Sphingomonas telluris]
MAELEGLTEQQRLQLLINSITDYAIYMLDSEGRVATWNPGAERFKGYTADEIIGQNFSVFFTPEDRAAGLPQRALRTAVAEGRFEAEGWRLRKDGSRFWVNAVLDPIFDPSGEHVGFAKITRDITAKRENDRALYESEQRFRMLVQGVRDYAIYMLDTDGRVTNWNAGAEAIKGYSADEIVGEHFSRFYTPEDRERGEPANALATALREGKYEREAWRMRKDGTLFWASVVLDPIFDESGRHIGFAKVTRDVTDRKRAQEELEETRTALVQSQKLQALGELTGGIAHDFNNLMTVVAGSADFLLRKPDLPDEKRKQYLKAITDTAERATTLTNHLLAFGRRQAIKPQVLDLNVRLDALAEVLSRTLGSTIHIELDLAPGLPSIEVDAAQLETAILNAAVNARDAMPDGGRLILATLRRQEKGADLVELSIRDTGSGMPKDVAERAFEPFFTTKEVGKGTGLGLSQIHGFAAQAGGRAEIRSEGKGTTIAILLPASRKTPAAAEEAIAMSQLPEGLCVLLVEDNPRVREFAQGLLIDLGCKVIALDSAEEALDRLASNSIDLVLSDVVMPGMSGVELAHKIQDAYPKVPVLLATGYSDEIVKRGSEFAVLAKPFGAADLSKAMAAVLTGKRERAA